MLQKLCAYNTWANSLVLEALKKISTSQTDKVPAQCLTLLSHIADAQVIWINRIKGIQIAVGVWQNQDLETCREMLQQSSSQLQEMILKGDSLDRLISYTRLSGEAYENTVSDILLHVFNHGTYHRAQIAMELRINGLEPINTDYILFVR